MILLILPGFSACDAPITNYYGKRNLNQYHKAIVIPMYLLIQEKNLNDNMLQSGLTLCPFISGGKQYPFYYDFLMHALKPVI